MVREVITCGCGTIFDASALAKFNLGPEPRTSDIEMNAIDNDALKPVHDELRINVIWWLLEIFPFPYSWQDVNYVWHTSYV
jgi:hypothetical protein